MGNLPLVGGRAPCDARFVPAILTHVGLVGLGFGA